MAVETAETIEAIDHLPPGATLRIDDVSWEAYEQLLHELGERPGVRIFYDEGKLEIMVTGYPHEKAKDVIHSLIHALRDELDIDVESAGSTTLILKMKAKGAEPDGEFYIQNAS